MASTFQCQLNPILTTPPKINMEPENDGLEDVFPLPGVYCQVPFLIFLGVNPYIQINSELFPP